MELDLYAVVLTFAILLPITSILVWWVLSPATPEKSDLIIVPVPPIDVERKAAASLCHSGSYNLLTGPVI